MSETNRRKFLTVAGGTAAAGVVATVAAGAGSAQAATSTRRSPGSAREAVVAYVEDHDSPRLRLMVGEREVVVHDRDLVARILNAAGGK